MVLVDCQFLLLQEYFYGDYSKMEMVIGSSFFKITESKNVNFAVKGTEALGFLRRAGVEPTLRESAPTELSAAEVGERAHPSTVFIRCEK